VIGGLPFPSGYSVSLTALPAVSSGRTTLADGSEGAQLQPELAKPPCWRFPEVSTDRLFKLADELGAMVALECELVLIMLRADGDRDLCGDELREFEILLIVNSRLVAPDAQHTKPSVRGGQRHNTKGMY